jgi:hypothetical protein
LLRKTLALRTKFSDKFQVTLQNCVKKERIGKGAFGQVWRVLDKRSAAFYAMKAIEQDKVGV